MTNEEAMALLAQIQEQADQHDDERAHALEDKLRERVLEAIMRGEGDPITLSVIALMSKSIPFSRWTA